MRAKRYMRPTVGSQLATAEARIEELTAEVSRLQRLRAAERALRMAERDSYRASGGDRAEAERAAADEADARAALRAAGGEP